MFSYSHTAPIVTPEQEENDFADLSQEEKENILNDIYGRNAEETEEFNRQDITQQLDDFQIALDRIPLADQVAYQMALIHCPDLLQSETSPRLFLIREAFDPTKAAKRLVKYWDMRVDLFGEERAFLPISLLEGGALEGDDELLAMMREFPNFRNFLPNDAHGRTIILCAPNFESETFNNYSRAAKIKYHWYFIHLAMKRESAIFRGLVYVIKPNPGMSFQHFDRVFYKRTVTAMKEAYPVRMRALHHFLKEKSFSKMILPAVKFFCNVETRFRLVTHVRLPLEEIIPYGFTEESLPVSLGGLFETNPNWVNGEFETGTAD